MNCTSPRLGETPLMYAAASDNVEAVRLLLSKGANPNAALKNLTMVRGGSTLDSGVGKQTPLMWAAPTGSPELIRALIDAGANVNAQDIQGMSPLMLAVASEEQDLAVVRVLLQIGRECKRAQRERRDGARLGQEIRQPSGDRGARKGRRAGGFTLSSSSRA